MGVRRQPYQPAEEIARPRAEIRERTWPILRLFVHPDCSKQPSIFLLRACCEVQNVGIASAMSAERQSPQTRVCNHLARAVLQLAKESAGCRIEGVNSSVSKVADEDVVPKAAEVRAGLRDSPRGV